MKTAVKFIYRMFPFKKYVFLALKYLRTPPESVYRHLYFNGVFRVRVNERAGFKIRHYGYQIENEIFWNGLTGGWEGKSMELWIALSEKAKVILDIGANTGVYSLVAKAIHPAAEVYAFEPVSRVYAKLVENIRLNQFTIRSYETAVSNTDGHAVIYDTAEEHILSVTINKNYHPPETAVIPIQVDTMALSTFALKQNTGKFDLIKIDVETHEPEVLEGLGFLLERDKPTLLIEVLNDDIGRQIEKIVHGKGYLYFNIDETKGIRRTDSIVKSDHYNYLLCQPETARELGLY